jgi:ankyrin repeat protein
VVAKGYTPLIRPLVRHFPIGINEANPQGWTPLHEAVYHGSVARVEELLNWGGALSLNKIAKFGAIQVTPLLLSVVLGNPDMLHFLLSKGADPLVRDNNNSRHMLAIALDCCTTACILPGRHWKDAFT